MTPVMTHSTPKHFVRSVKTSVEVTAEGRVASPFSVLFFVLVAVFLIPLLSPNRPNSLQTEGKIEIIEIRTGCQGNAWPL